MDVCATKVVKSIKRNRSDAENNCNSLSNSSKVCVIFFNVEKNKK